jgi:hypothetical protein
MSIVNLTPTINVEKRADVVQHAHHKNVGFNFKSPSLGISTNNYILVDISDNTNYKHAGNDYVHFENINIKIDSDNAGIYVVSLGFLANVDVNNGDFYEFLALPGSKQAGNSFIHSNELYPNGPRCKNDFIVTSTISLNDATYQTDVNLKTIRNPAAADTAPGDGDIILKAVITAGNIVITSSGSYHGH